MEVFTMVAVVPASFGLALLVQFGILKAIVWALAYRRGRPSRLADMAL